jgi:hypothetical protein
MVSHIVRFLAMYVGALFVVASVCSIYLQLHGAGESFWDIAKLVPALEMAAVASALSLMVPSMHYGQSVYALHDSWATDGREGLSQHEQMMLLPEALLTGSSIKPSRGRSPYAGYPEIEVFVITCMVVALVLFVAFGEFLERIPSDDGKGTMAFAPFSIPVLHGIVNAAYVHALKKVYVGKICFSS